MVNNHTYLEELNNLLQIQKFDPTGRYTPKLIFAGIMYTEDLLHLCTFKTPIFLKVFYFIS